MASTNQNSAIGLALGSGAARGLAHIGILKVLTEAKVPIRLVTGTSIGAFIGALYAAEVPVDRMETAACDLDWRRLTSFIDPVLPFSGLIDGKKLMAFMAELLPVRTFEELSLPLAVTATDIKTGEAVIIKQGGLLEALRASLAFPGIFSPVRFGSRHLVDGGLCNPVPVDIARSLGAERVVGICTIPRVAKEAPETFVPAGRSKPSLNRRLRSIFSADTIEEAFGRIFGDGLTTRNAESFEEKAPNIFRICAQSVAIMENEINELRLGQNRHDLIIRPSLEDITLLEFFRAKEIIAAGETAARADLARIRDLLGSD